MNVNLKVYNMPNGSPGLSITPHHITSLSPNITEHALRARFCCHSLLSIAEDTCNTLNSNLGQNTPI